MRLNLGCGRDIRPGWVNVDKYPAPGVDVVADVDRELPFPSGSVERMYASHVLEHVRDLDRTMREIWRVLEPGGVLDARVPYGFNGYPYHRRFFTKLGVRMMDVRPDNEADVLTLEVMPFRLLGEVEVHRTGGFPWWHAETYLGIRLPTLPFDPRRELRFELQKWVPTPLKGA